jgi:DoxX-like protein
MKPPAMDNYLIASQLIIAFSIVVVWVFRFDNIVEEFRQYGLPDLVRNVVGATKIALSTLLVTGIWYPSLVAAPALVMALLMGCAQMAHLKVSNPWHKRLPSLGLLVLSLFVAAVHLGLLSL